VLLALFRAERLCYPLTSLTIVFSLNHIFLISNFVRVGGQLNTPPALSFIYSTSTPITTTPNSGLTPVLSFPILLFTLRLCVGTRSNR